MIPEPSFDDLVRDLFVYLPSPCDPSPSASFVDLLSPYLRARFAALSLHARTERPAFFWSSQLVLSTHPNVSQSVAEALHSVNAIFAGRLLRINGIKRVDEGTLLASALLPVNGLAASQLDADTPDESELELVWVYVDLPGRRGWKLHEIKMAVMDELCYWRQWSDTVPEAEANWIEEVVCRKEKDEIKAALLQSQVLPNALNTSVHSKTELLFRDAATEVPLEDVVVQNSYGEDSDDDYWNRYDTITPSPELLESLRTIRRLEEMSAGRDDNSRPCHSSTSSSVSSSWSSSSRPALHRDLSFSSVSSSGFKRPATEPAPVGLGKPSSKKPVMTFLPLLPTEEFDESRLLVERQVRHAMSGLFRLAQESGMSAEGFSEIVREAAATAVC